MMTKEESLELAKKCGADLQETQFLDECDSITFNQEQLLAYTSAIEEKHREYEDNLRTKLAEHEQRHLRDKAENAQLKKSFAMMHNALEEVRPYFDGEHHPDHPACKIIRAAIDDTQATADAWEAEVKARALEDVRDRIPPSTCRPFSKRSEGYDDAINEVHVVIDKMAAEFRNQAQAEGNDDLINYVIDRGHRTVGKPEQPRKPCTCDGWCDGLCLEKEGKRK